MSKTFEILPPKKVKIVPIKGKGYGVIATANIKKGETIETFPIVFISHKDSEFLNDHSDVFTFYPLYLESYKKDCVMFGYGSIYNHSHQNPNADIYYPKKDFDRYLSILATRNIKKGEEIVYDYEFEDNEEEFLKL